MISIDQRFKNLLCVSVVVLKIEKLLLRCSIVFYHVLIDGSYQYAWEGYLRAKHWDVCPSHPMHNHCFAGAVKE